MMDLSETHPVCKQIYFSDCGAAYAMPTHRIKEK